MEFLTDYIILMFTFTGIIGVIILLNYFVSLALTLMDKI